MAPKVLEGRAARPAPVREGAAPPPAGRARVAVAVAFMACAGLLSVWTFQGWGPDLAPLYIAGRLAAEGQADLIYVFRPDDGPAILHPAWARIAAEMGYDRRIYAFVFPPVWAHLLAGPASVLSWQACMTTVAALSGMSMAGIAVVGSRLWAPPGSATRVTLLSLALMTLAWPTVSSAWFNQVQPMITLAVVLGLEAAERGRPARAGILLALAASVKLSPAVFGVYWLLTGRWRAAGWALGAGASLFAINLAVAGADETRAFFEQIVVIGDVIPNGGMNQSLLIFVSGLLGGEPENIAFAAPLPPGALMITTALALAVLALAAARLLPRGAEARRARLMPVVMAVTLLAAPLAWAHYFTFMIPWAVAMRERLRFGALVAAAAMAPMLVASLVFWKARMFSLDIALLTLAALAILIFASILLPDRKRPPSDDGEEG